MRQELRRQDRMAAVGELATGVAHEIRNPVAVIRSAVEELRGNLDAHELVAKLAEMVVQESDQLNEIIEGFLDFSRNPVRAHETFDLRSVLDEVVESLHRTHGQGGAHNMVVHAPEKACSVVGDRNSLRQVFVNLGANALESMENGGTLDISIERVGGSFEVRFDDEGPGLEPDQVAHIFEPFYTTKESGVGMGLAVSLRIVTAHDGVIRASSRGEGGTRMTVRLPAAAE
ncbi:MAG TPA: hypothetical protein ENN80_06065 [Candidatus Hydrogenedentes bacterium]|nr:hypothetical protein [Candidatus Hydrogenedentota bacterium]